MQVRFDRFVLDSEAKELRTDLGPIHLSPKAYQLLEVLVERRPKALSKNDLRDLLWPGTFVVEANLANLVAEIRAALGDKRARPRFVRTVHGFGYAFREGPGVPAQASVGPEAESRHVRSAHWVVWDRNAIPLEPGENVLGRGDDVAVRVASPGVSRRHARIVVREGEVTLEDLGSKNGTFLRDQPIEAPTRLVDGDTIRLGRQGIVFRSSGAESSTFTEVVGPTAAR